MPNDATNPRGTSQFEPLTFDAGSTAGTPGCSKCGTALRGSYHLIGESMACAKCRYAAEGELRSGTGAAGLLRAIAFGSGAAIVGAAAYYAFVKLTDHEWALITAFLSTLLFQQMLLLIT